MKKIFLICSMLITLIFTTTGAYAMQRDLIKVGVVTVSGSEFKSQTFYRYGRERLTDPSYNLFIGEEVQSLYQKYWLDKGFVEEQYPSKNDLIDFVKYSGYDKVLYLIVADPQSDKEITRGWFSSWVDYTTCMQINGVLCSKEAVLALHNVSKNTSSSNIIKANQKAYKFALREIHDYMIPEIKK